MKIRLCSKCKTEKPLTTEFFNRRSNRPDGFRYDCKVCFSQWRRNDRQLHPEKYRDGDRRGNEKKTSEQRVKWNLNYKKKNREKIRAQGQVYYWKRKGKLIPEPCEVCGDKRVHAHHKDYSKPLEVNWLCHKHHMKWHFDNNMPR